MTARPVDIVVIGSMYYDGHQLTDQRLARALARSGNRVVYVEPGIKPIARKHATSQGRPARIGLSIADGVDVFTPVALPLNGRRVMGSLSATLVFLQLLTVPPVGIAPYDPLHRVQRSP